MIVERHVAITDPKLARDVAGVLERSERQARSSGIDRPDVRALIDDLRTFSREAPRIASPSANGGSREGAGRSRNGSAVNVRRVTAAAYAELVGTTRRAVTDRCRRGTLPAELTSRGWRIFIPDETEEM